MTGIGPTPKPWLDSIQGRVSGQGSSALRAVSSFDTPSLEGYTFVDSRLRPFTSQILNEIHRRAFTSVYTP